MKGISKATIVKEAYITCSIGPLVWEMIGSFFSSAFPRSICGQTFQLGTSAYGYPRGCNVNRQAAADYASLSKAQKLEWSWFEWVGQCNSEKKKSKQRVH